MRDRIKQRLIADIPAIGGRVLEPQEPYAAVDKPYLVVQQGRETGASGFPGFRRRYEVWVYEARTAGFAAVDEWASAVIQSLDEQTVVDPDTGETWCLRYIGSFGRDRIDADRDAIGRCLRFAVDAVQPATQAETVPDDPWLTALGQWTAALLGEPWRVWLNRWPSGDDERPAVLWRLTGQESPGGNAAAAIVRKRAAGHVIGRTDNEQSEAVSRIAEALKLDAKILLDESSRRWLTFSWCQANFAADPMTEGQLTVALERRMPRGHDAGGNAPLIGEVFFHPKNP